MSYNPEIPKNKYDNYEDREWTRLKKMALGMKKANLALTLQIGYLIQVSKMKRTILSQVNTMSI